MNFSKDDLRIERRDARGVTSMVIPLRAFEMWLDHGAGPDKLIQLLDEASTANGEPPPPPNPESPAAEGPPPRRIYTDAGNIASPGIEGFEAWLRAHPGSHTVLDVVAGITGLPPEEIYPQLYVRRNPKSKGGTSAYTNLKSDFRGAVALLEREGWGIDCSRHDGRKGVWTFTPPEPSIPGALEETPSEGDST